MSQFLTTNRPKGRCHYCKRGPLLLTKDHVIPRARGGTNARANLVPACVPCNLAKRDLLPDPEHVANCRRCQDAVEYHWAWITGFNPSIRVSLLHKVYPLFALRPMPLNPRSLPVASVGWDPYADDYPGEEDTETRDIREPRLR